MAQYSWKQLAKTVVIDIVPSREENIVLTPELLKLISDVRGVEKVQEIKKYSICFYSGHLFDPGEVSKDIIAAIAEKFGTTFSEVQAKIYPGNKRDSFIKS